MKKYKVTLTTEERKSLQELVAAGKASSKMVLQARILLKADASPRGPACTDGRIADALEVSTRTIERLRERFVEQGLDAALGRKPQDRPSRQRGHSGYFARAGPDQVNGKPAGGNGVIQVISRLRGAIRLMGNLNDPSALHLPSAA
jgi:hypothetical protein